MLVSCHCHLESLWKMVENVVLVGGDVHIGGDVLVVINGGAVVGGGGDAFCW